MGTPVAVLGQTVVENLFSDSTVDPVGQNIRINTDIFRVVGVLQSKGAQGAANADDVIFVPFSAASERLKPSQYVNQIQLQVDDINNVSQVQLEATALLRQRHHLIGPDPALTQQNGGTTTRNFSSLGGGGGGAFFRRNGNGGGAASSTGARGRNSRVTAQPDDFQVLNVNQVIQTAQQNSAVLTTLLIGIAAISLTVGGIGIMNIMLVSVTERVREIGIMMAVGARQRDVLHQFLLEALLLSVVGGLIGIVIGVLIGFALTVGLGFPFVVSLIPIVVAFGVSAIVGVTFGFYPAMRASRLDPILALHSE
jgi:putative ABC transport system permease protein